eukprot:COSAG05_NODE_937_length_6525_cov_6.136632_5_plen_206_part_00
MPSLRLLFAHQWTDGLVLGGDALSYFTAAHYFSNVSHADDAHYVATLSSRRLQLADYLLYGRLMRPPVLVNSSVPSRQLCSYWGASPTCCPVEQPALQLWRSKNGTTLALLAVNSELTPISFSAQLDVSGLGLGIATGERKSSLQMVATVAAAAAASSPSPTSVGSKTWVASAEGVNGRWARGVGATVRYSMPALSTLTIEVKLV